MSEELPRFTSRGSIRPLSTPGAGSFFENLSGTFARVSQTFQRQVFRQQIGRARTEGLEAGQAPGFRAATGTNAATEAFNQTALAANKSAIGADAIQRINQLKMEFGTNITPQSLSHFTAVSEQFAKTELALAPAQNRAFLRNVLTNQTMRAASEIGNKVHMQANRIAFNGWNQNVSVYQAAASNAARNGDTPTAMAMMAIVQRNADGLVAKGILSPALANAQVEGMKTQVWSADAMRHLDVAKDPVKAVHDFLNEKSAFGKRYNDIFTPQQREEVVRRWRNLQRMQRESQAGGLRQLDTNKKAYLKAVSEGTPRSAVKESTFEHENPATAPSFKAAIADSANAGSKIIGSRSATIGENTAQMGKLQQEIDAPPTSATPEGLRQHRLAQTTFNGIKKNNEAITKSPYQTVVSQDPVLRHQIKALKTQVVTADPNTNASGYEAQSLQYRQKTDDLALQAQRGRGVLNTNLQVMTNADATQHATTINTLLNSGQMGAIIPYLDSIRLRFGQNAGVALRQTSRSGAPPGLMMIDSMAHSQDPSVSADTSYSLESMKPGNTVEALKIQAKFTAADTKAFNAQMKVSGANWIATQNAYNGATDKNIQTAQGVVERLGMQLVISKGLDPAAAVVEAWGDYFNKRYTYSNWRGGEYRIPNRANVTEGQVQNANQAFSESVVKNVANLTIPKNFSANHRGLNDKEMRVQYASSLEQGGHFVTNTDDSGMEFMDAAGTPVKDKNGGAQVYHFKDITEPAGLLSDLSARTQRLLEVGKEAAKGILFSSVSPLTAGA